MDKIIWVIIVAGLYFGYEEGLFDDLLSEIPPSFSFRKSINEMSCEDVKNQVKGMKLQNNFGGSLEILKVRNAKEQLKTDKNITCVGDGMFSDASNKRLSMKITEDTDGDRFIGVEVLQ
jgi:hypothetical protein